jgi:hypothetical protein
MADSPWLSAPLLTSVEKFAFGEAEDFWDRNSVER